MSFALHGVTVRHLRAAARHRAALEDITLSAAQGEHIALIGPSGAGKTTLLHTLACALTPVDGTFRLLETSPWALSHGKRHALRKRLFLAPQTPPLPPRQRVVTAVLAGRLPRWSLGQALWSLLRPSSPEQAYEALARFELGDKLYMRVDRLSGGERQRCSLARLLVSDAELFLVDEPLSALDPALSRQILSVLQEEATARKATMVCSLHQVDLALACFPRIVGLREGRIVFDAPRAAVSDAMIADLYRQAGTGLPLAVSPGAETDMQDPIKPAPAARCF